MNKTLLAAAIAIAYSAVPAWANPTNNFTGDLTVTSSSVPVPPASETAKTTSLDNGSAGASGGFKQTATANSTQNAGDMSPQANEYGQANNNVMNDNDTKTINKTETDTKNISMTKTDTDTKNISMTKTDTDTTTKSGNFDNKGDAKAKDQAASANNSSTASTNSSDQDNDKSAGDNRNNDGKVMAKDNATAANNGSTATSSFANAFNTSKAIAKIELNGTVSDNTVSGIGKFIAHHCTQTAIGL